MGTKTFRGITSTSAAISLTAAILSIIGIIKTGFYPAIIVLFLLALIPLASKFYTKKIVNKTGSLNKDYYTILAIINLLSIVIVLWIAFVIVHDRILLDCC